MGIEQFWLTMSQDRFFFLLQCLRFDNLETREERRQFDKLAPIRSLWDSFVENCKKGYSLGENTTIDEKLEAFRGRCSFRQYIFSKPNKYGIKIFALVDSAISYAANLKVYVGKQPPGPYEVPNDNDSFATDFGNEQKFNTRQLVHKYRSSKQIV